MPLTRRMDRAGRGSLGGELVAAADWDSDDVNELAISSGHVIAAGRLPLIHRDPFDRMLVAQARCEDLMLVTRDPHCQKYGVAVLPA